MTDPFTLNENIPPLRQPVMIVAMAGWIDASGAAAAAMAILEAECAASTIATFDGDTFIDYRARRPTMEIVDGVHKQLTWPTIELRAGRDLGGVDVLLLTGPEPDMSWRLFCDAVARLAKRLEVTQMISLGAYPFATPHTRPPRLSTTSPSAEAIASLPYLKNSVEVPAGMAAALAHELHQTGIRTLGMWAQVPHYVSAMAYPAATVALIDGLKEASGVSVEAASARQESVVQRQRLDQLVAGNSEHESMVRELERLYDEAVDAASSGFTAADLPSGDELAEELERFLRDQGKD